MSVASHPLRASRRRARTERSEAPCARPHPRARARRRRPRARTACALLECDARSRPTRRRSRRPFPRRRSRSTRKRRRRGGRARPAPRRGAQSRPRSRRARSSAVAAAWPARCGARKRLVLGEDRLLELLELRAGLEAELGDERLARVRVRVERVRLTPGAVEREHQLCAQPLAQRVRSNERRELADQLRVPPAGEVGVDPRLECCEPLLLELAARPGGERARSRDRRAAGRARARAPREASARRPRATSSSSPRPRSTSRRKRSRSTCSGAISRAYPGARVTSTSCGSSALRSRETCC